MGRARVRQARHVGAAVLEWAVHCVCIASAKLACFARVRVGQQEGACVWRDVPATAEVTVSRNAAVVVKLIQ